MIPVLASAVFGFLKGWSSPGREAFHAEQDLYGPMREELIYRSAALGRAPNLPYGSTAVSFAADHVASETRGSTLKANDIAARFGDVLLGGLLYETAARRYGFVGAAAAHILHNSFIAIGSKARRKLR